jgi:hypothetical protein
VRSSRKKSRTAVRGSKKPASGMTRKVLPQGEGAVHSTWNNFCGTLLLPWQTEKVSGVSNAKRPRPSEPEPPAPFTSQEPDSSPPLPLDSLGAYRGALSDLAAAQEKLTTLRQLETSLRADADGNATQREKVLADSVNAPDEDSAIEELSRLRSRSELYERKLADVTARIADAEEQLSTEQSAVACRFSAMWHGFFQWSLERAKDSLSEQLIPGVAPHIIELVARHHKSVQPIRALDIRTTDAQGVLESGGRLLEAVSEERGFKAPPYVPPTPTAPELDPLWTPGVPWGDRGVNVDEEIRQMHAKDPSLTLPRAMRLLYEKFPHIFTPPKEGNLSLNEPLPWKAPMIGSTTVSEPAEQEFSHAR